MLEAFIVLKVLRMLEAVRMLEPATPELCEAAAHPGSGCPDQLAVVPSVGGELVLGHGAGGEHGDLAVPRGHGLGPLRPQVSWASVEGLVEVLTNPVGCNE